MAPAAASCLPLSGIISRRSPPPYGTADQMPTARRPLAPLTFALAIAGAFAPACVAAQANGQGPEPPPQQDRPAEHRALSDAVRRVERATNGQVLSAERVQFDGRDVNRVKIIDDRGRVRVYWDDPQSRSAERREQEREAGDRRRAVPNRSEPPSRRDDPPRRTRRHDGAAFNL